MNIKDLKQTLAKTIEDVEKSYQHYTGKVSELNSSIKKNEMKQMQLMRDEQRLDQLLEKYEKVESLEKVRKDAEGTVKAAEQLMSEVAGARAKFETYKSKENAVLCKRELAVDEGENIMLQRERNLQNAIKTFNEDVEKYNYKTEGPAHF